ncbi:RNA-directed DNA polymerase, eukaryota, reverse transcriptase zinc-binding domain protein [Tanacetum coccineum]
MLQMEILKGGTCGLIHKQIAIGKPWVIGGDMNVILKTNEHSAGISFACSEMQEFNDYVNMIKVEDLCSSGLFFTLTKNLKKAREGNDTGVLKKLDRVMAVIVIPNGMKKKKKAFRFANFVADKEAFIPTIEKEWKKQIDGFQMFQLVKKMRSLKFYLRKLNWQNGNLFENLEEGRYQRNRIERVQNVNDDNFEGEEVADHLNADEASLWLKMCPLRKLKKHYLILVIIKLLGLMDIHLCFLKKLGRTASFTINVNGENCGFFKDGRSLRQGDPMSPHLFTLVMECFTLMMERNVKKNLNFQYPFRCKSMKITNVCSADDLLVLYHGDDESVKVVRDYINEFRECSGLLPNFNKSIIFFSNVKDEVQEEIMKVLPF